MSVSLSPGAAYGRCGDPALIDCSSDCGDIRYCSQTCCDLHKPEHEAICAMFRAQDERTTGYPDYDMHYRAIFFPKDDEQPRFVWLQYRPSKAFHLSSKTIETLIKGPVEKRHTMRSGHDHQWLEIFGKRSLSPDPSQNNKSLAKALGWGGSGVWRGNFLVVGLQQEDFERIDGIDDKENGGKTTRARVPVDLGVRDLATVIAYLGKS